VLSHASHLTAARRARELEELAGGREVDVLVVGGGVTGTGVALDAASRGLSVALLERGDLAQGTSRWSSKLAHGGLRYLASGDVGVAWESAAERAILADRTAPHLVRALPQLLALQDGVGRRAAGMYAAGVRAGDALRRAAGTSAKRLPRTRRVGVAEAQRWFPTLDAGSLRGGILSWDGQLEDDARLVIALARTAAAHGARVLTRVAVDRLDGDGADARDALTGAALRIKARHVVNATGVWAGTLAPAVRLRPSRGSHVLVAAGRLGDPAAALNVPVPGHFGRFVFALPRPDGLVLCGLTDVEVSDGALPDAPQPTAEEERFLLATLSTALDRELTAEDVVGRFAGLRPLLDSGDGAASADVSRRHAVLDDPATGVITVVGGKLTTYRRMAQDAVDVVAARPGVAAGACRTRDLPLVGAARVPAPSGAPPRLVRRFGSEAADVAAHAHGDPAALAPLAPGVPACLAELRFALAAEGALDADDLLDRRTRLGLVGAWREAALPAAERVLAERAAVAP
jgi:glycerol-3-phosphate dehydrogenase